MSEFSDLFGDWASHGVTVKPRLGKNVTGDVFGAPVTLDDVMVEEERQVVVTADGKEAVSNAAIYVEPADIASFPDQSEVTLPSGRVAKVLAVKTLDVFGLPGHGVVRVS